MSTSKDPRCRACSKRKLSDGKEIVVVRCHDSEDEYMDAAESRRNQLFYKVLELFPDAEPKYLRKLCGEREYSKHQLDKMINELLSNPDYPRRIQQDEESDDGIYPDRDFEMLKQVLPDADPNYLLHKLSRITTQEELKMFITNAVEKKNYPTYAEYLRKQQFNAQTKQYTTEFNVKKFVKLFPDPEKYFGGPKRKVIKVDNLSNNYYYVLGFLRLRYSHISVKQIKYVLHKSFDVFETCKLLDECTTGFIKATKHAVLMVDNVTDIPLLQLLAYIKNKDEILHYIKTKKRIDEKHRLTMKKLGLLLTCSCCYDDEIIPDEAIYCQNNCIFCKPCLEKSVEISYGEGKLKFFCLTDCGAELNLQIIQSAVNPKLFSRIAQKKQVEEVKAAGIEELEFCPFCDFATIPAPQDKLFKCLNPECMKESCRSCKESSHLPLKCEEVEKDSEVKKRTYVEDKMTDALIRKCWKCGLKFIKSDGCNKITCSCGAMMCYICNKPVENYKHFNGQGGSRHDLCPLYSDTNLLHKEQVLQGAATAKAELGDDVFKIDPTADVQQYYDDEMKRNPFKIPTGDYAGRDHRHRHRHRVHHHHRH